MKTQVTLVAVAVALTLAQLPLSVAAQSPTPKPAAAAPAATPAPVTARSPTDWIVYDDATYTPVLDDVSQALAEVRSALAKQDRAKAAEAMTAAAHALQRQADRAGTIDRQHAAADMKLARETHARMLALTRKLEATAAQIQSGQVATTAALDKTLDKAARADLERRWLVTDVAGWYPVADEPQRHFGAAAQAYARQDYRAAATELRKAAAFVRLESARSVGQAKQGLDAAEAHLERMARGLDQGAIKTGKDLNKAFAEADHALALAHRSQAAESWAHKAYEQAGYELKSAAQGLEAAADWTGAQATSAAMAGVSDARTVGDKLASGGVWAKDEVAKGFETLGSGLNHLGQSIGLKSKASSFDVGA
jgi:hypothetical protein